MPTSRLIAGLAAACLAWPAWRAAAEVASGLEVGAPTASIPVVDVTGPYKGQRICYVCEFQDDPNVLAFFKDTGADTAQLIVGLNQLYLQHRDEGFKAVAMIVAGESAATWLEELSARENLEIPLTYFRRGPNDVAARLYELDPAVDNTFLVTIDRFVSANVSAIGPDGFEAVTAATARMLAERAD